MEGRPQSRVHAVEQEGEPRQRRFDDRFDAADRVLVGDEGVRRDRQQPCWPDAQRRPARGTSRLCPRQRYPTRRPDAPRSPRQPFFSTLLVATVQGGTTPTSAEPDHHHRRHAYGTDAAQDRPTPRRAEKAADRRNWGEVIQLTRDVIALHEANEDARALIAAAERRQGEEAPDQSRSEDEAPSADGCSEPSGHTSFAGSRYQVRELLGEGSKKRVHLAHHELIDRDVAFALIKTDGLDEVGRERIAREAQAMGRLAGC